MPSEALLQDIENVISVYERETGVAASATRLMIERHGPIEALSRLVVSADLQRGFRVLRDSGRLDMTFESLIVRHARHFRDEVVAAAKWRLEHPDLLE